MSTHTLPELYETLSSGGTFRMRFSCKEDAKIFRNKLATFKHRSEKDLKLMGVIEHQTLNMTYDDDTNIANFQLKQPLVVTQTYEILDDTTAP